MLYHRYNIDKEKVISCDIVTPTAQNLASMNDIATTILRGRKTDTNSVDIAKKIAISFDPCISCSVHTQGKNSKHKLDILTLWRNISQTTSVRDIQFYN